MPRREGAIADRTPFSYLHIARMFAHLTEMEAGMNLKFTRPQRFSHEIDARWFWLPFMIQLCLLGMVLLLPLEATKPDQSGSAPWATAASSPDLPVPLTASVSTSEDSTGPISPRSQSDKTVGP